MKKIIIYIMLVLCLSSAASAFVPVVIPAWVYAAPAVLAVVGGAAGLYYGMRPDIPAAVNAAGNITRQAGAVYVLAGEVLSVKDDEIVAHLPLANYKAIANKKVGSTPVYPLNNAVVNPPGHYPQPVLKPVSNLVAGQSYELGGKGHEYVSQTGSTGGGCVGGDINRTYTEGNFLIWEIQKHNSENCFDTDYYYNVFFKLADSVDLPPSPASDNDAKAGLSGSSDGGTVKPELQAELDKMYQDPDYVPVFTGKTTGLPYVPPGNVLSPSSLAAQNAAMNAASLQTLVEAAAADYAEEARLAAVAAAATLTTAQAELAADPSNVDKQKAVTTAAAASTAATITSAQAATTSAQTTAAASAAAATQAATVAATAAGVPTLPARKSVDLTPFNTLNGALSTTYPFNLPNSIAGYFTAFKGTSTAPVFTLPMPLGEAMTVNLSVFNPVAVLIRYMIGLLVTVGILFYLIHFYRGIS